MGLFSAHPEADSRSQNNETFNRVELEHTRFLPSAKSPLQWSAGSVESSHSPSFSPQMPL